MARSLEDVVKSVKVMFPTVCAPSNVMVRVAVMFWLKRAVAPLPLATMPPVHLLESLQAPSASKPQVPFEALKVEADCGAEGALSFGIAAESRACTVKE